MYTKRFQLCPIPAAWASERAGFIDALQTGPPRTALLAAEIHRAHRDVREHTFFFRARGDHRIN